MTITVGGIDYPTITAASIAHGIDNRTVRSRLRLKWTIEESFGLEKHEHGNGKSIEVNGVRYKSIKNAATVYKIDVRLVIDRIDRGWTLEEAFELVSRQRIGKEIVVCGIKFSSIKEASDFFDVDYNKTKSRIENGWTLEQVFGFEVRKYAGKGGYSVTGKIFKSFRAACRHYDVNPATVRYRLKQGFSINKAFGIDPILQHIRPGGVVYIISNTTNNKVYIGITKNSLSSRLRQHVRPQVFPSKLNTAIQEIGAKNFKILEICRADTDDELVEKERFYISKYQSITNGYNSAVGGSLGGNRGKPLRYGPQLFKSISHMTEQTQLSRANVEVLLKKGLAVFVQK